MEFYYLQKEIVTGKFKFDVLYNFLVSGVYGLEQELSLIILYCQFCKPKQAEVDKLRRLLVEQFGPKAELALMCNSDLITNIPKHQSLVELNKIYGLLSDDNIGKQECLNQSFGFIQPLSVKIVESILKKDQKKDGIVTHEVHNEGEADKILVVMIGPLTHGEASAFEVLRKQETNLDIVCTDLCDGLEIMKLMSE